MGDLDVVAKKYEVTPAYIRSLLQKNKEFQQIMDDFCGAMLTIVRGSVVGLSNEALQVIAEIMRTSSDPKERLKAAQDILNRAGLVAQGKDSNKDTVVNIVFDKDMFSDEEKNIISTTYTTEEEGEGVGRKED